MALNKYKRLLSNTLIFAIGTFSSKVLVFLLMPLYTTVLTDAEYGTVDLMVQVGNFLLPLVSCGITGEKNFLNQQAYNGNFSGWTAIIRSMGFTFPRIITDEDLESITPESHPVVILPFLSQHYMMLQRNLLYTAMTRAKKLLILVGSRRAVQLAVENARLEPRSTLLTRRLQEKRRELQRK